MQNIHGCTTLPRGKPIIIHPCNSNHHHCRRQHISAITTKSVLTARAPFAPDKRQNQPTIMWMHTLDNIHHTGRKASHTRGGTPSQHSAQNGNAKKKKKKHVPEGITLRSYTYEHAKCSLRYMKKRVLQQYS